MSARFVNHHSVFFFFFAVVLVEKTFFPHCRSYVQRKTMTFFCDSFAEEWMRSATCLRYSTKKVIFGENPKVIHRKWPREVRRSSISTESKKWNRKLMVWNWRKWASFSIIAILEGSHSDRLINERHQIVDHGSPPKSFTKTTGPSVECCEMKSMPETARTINSAINFRLRSSWNNLGNWFPNALPGSR